jgi:integrase/recombinase XerD
MNDATDTIVWEANYKPFGEAQVDPASTVTNRHTCATHMMKNGAPVRHIQELLGHESLESTQIYTRVTINDLKAVHMKYHPGNHFRSKK